MGAAAGAEKRGGTGGGAGGRPAQGAQGRAFRSSIPEPRPVGFAGRVGSQPGASRGKACPAPVEGAGASLPLETRLGPLEDGGETLAAADAHGLQTVARIAEIGRAHV